MAKKMKEDLNLVDSEQTQIYCGPSLPGFQQFTTIMGIPKHIGMHIEACPQIRQLIVNVSDLNRIRLKLSVKGSYEQQLYTDITSYLKEVRR